MIYFNVHKKKGVIRCVNKDVEDAIKFKFSMEPAGSMYSQARSNRDTRKYAINKFNNTFSIGILKDILTYVLVDLQYPMDQVNIDPEIYKILNPNRGISINPTNILKFKGRYYQDDAVKAALTAGRGMILHGTGAGKTFTTASIIQSYYEYDDSLKILVIIPTPTLMNQTYDDFISYNMSAPISVMGTDNRDVDKSAFCTMISHKFLISKYRGTKPKEDENGNLLPPTTKPCKSFMKQWDVIIIDEAHCITPGNALTNIVKTSTTPKLYGLTGTLPDNDYISWYIKGFFGGILHEKDANSLRSEGYLANAHITAITCVHTVPAMKYREELEFLHSHNRRNGLIYNLCAHKLKGTTLILYHKTLQGEKLYDACCYLRDANGHDRQIYIIQGTTDIDERKRIQQLMEDNDNVIVIAQSKIFSTGLSVNNIQNVMFIDGGKAFVSIVQSIGRGLRLHKDKEVLNIIDIHDNLEYSQQHYSERATIYQNENIPLTYKTVAMG